mmetsp:Transcript_5001/g.15072  ORF Transcript_5001/g.15072 Transcript_5001/m.15072 type:complete len:202 (+) Transcript_5001:666-1271(+)
MHQGTAREGTVLLEVEQLSDPRLLHQHPAPALQRAERERDLCVVHDREQAIVYGVFHDDLGIAAGVDLAVELSALVALGGALLVRVVQGLLQDAVLVVAERDGRVGDVLEFLAEGLPVESFRCDQEWEDIRDDADAPAFRKHSRLSLLPILVEAKQRIRCFVLIAYTKRTSRLSRGQLRQSWRTPLVAELRGLLEIAAGRV